MAHRTGHSGGMDILYCAQRGRRFVIYRRHEGTTEQIKRKDLVNRIVHAVQNGGTYALAPGYADQLDHDIQTQLARAQSGFLL
ncbi:MULTISPECIES: hypothetical protein [Actinomycetes]|uniref:hypothetical protein n=1 Tax=Actinomycetes TaxID=1760 RepID=UPI0001B57680|nr:MULTISPECIES: hypothetical protein [Actinomycetes]